MPSKNYLQTISLTLFILLFFLTGCTSKQDMQTISENADYKDASLSIEKRVDDLLSYMRLEEKIAQMGQAATYAIDPDSVRSNALGSVLCGGSDGPKTGFTAKDWLTFVNEYQQSAIKSRLGIPIIFGVDAVHGHAKALGATVFPHNIGLGAANDAALVEKISRITAIEVAASGIHLNFSPSVAVARDERWGRTYESYSETPEITSALGAAYVKGHQGSDLSARDTAATSVKHFFADGGAEWGSSSHGIDRGNSTLSDAMLRKIHLAPYIAAVKQNPASIMISFSGIAGVEMHGNKKWIDVLRDELGFKGMIISDWAGHKELKGDNQYAQSINAGIDMIMIPEEYPIFIAEVMANVMDGVIKEERIDEAVRKILTLKFKLGLFDNAIYDESLLAKVGSDEHMDVAREAVRKSLVLLKNTKQTLPLATTDKLAIVGTKSKDLGALSGGWTVFWGGYSEYEPLNEMLDRLSVRARNEKLFIKGTNILDAFTTKAGETNIIYSDDGKNLSGAKKAIVVIGEVPYAEYTGDAKELTFTKADIDKVKNAKKQGIPVIAVVVSGRPLILKDIEPYCDAIVAAWLPGSMAGPGIADVFYGDHNFTGKLSFTWPEKMSDIPINQGDGKKGLFPVGYGLTY